MDLSVVCVVEPSFVSLSSIALSHYEAQLCWPAAGLLQAPDQAFYWRFTCVNNLFSYLRQLGANFTRRANNRPSLALTHNLFVPFGNICLCVRLSDRHISSWLKAEPHSEWFNGACCSSNLYFFIFFYNISSKLAKSSKWLSFQLA